MSPDDPRHGTEAGHEQHRRDGEDPCPACVEGDLRAGRRRSKRKAMGHLYTRPLGQAVTDKLAALRAKGATHDDIAVWAGISPSQAWRCCNVGPEAIVYTRTWVALDRMKSGRLVTPIGITRRLRALAWLGYSPQIIADTAGVNLDTVRDARHAPREFLAARVKDALADVYEQLCMTPPTPDNQQRKAGIVRVRRFALKHGWVSPLSWDDIDDPREQPRGMRQPTPIRTRKPDIEAAECPRCGVRRQVRVTAKRALCPDCKCVEQEVAS